MVDNDIYRYISSLHDNPRILIISKSLIFKPNMKAWIYSVDGSDSLLVTEDDINQYLEQIKILGLK